MHEMLISIGEIDQIAVSSPIMAVWGALVAASCIVGSTISKFGIKPIRYFSSATSVVDSTYPATGAHQPQDIATAFESKDVAILYGSFSGNSQSMAQRLTRELSWRLKLRILTGSLDYFNYESLHEIPDTKRLILIMSTYGRGGPTTTAEKFWNHMFTTTNTTDWTKLHYCLFGRGSSLYPTFNFAALKMDQQLQDLGAVSFSPYGQTDKLSQTTEDDYYTWKENIVYNLKESFGLEEQPYVYKPSVDLQELPNNVTKETIASTDVSEVLKNYSILSPDLLVPQFSPASIKSSRDRDGRKFLHGEFDLSKTTLQYTTGDYFVVWPTNDQEEVDLFLTAFNLQSKRNTSCMIDSRWTATYEELAKHYISINGLVSRELVSILAPYAPTEESKTEALRLSKNVQAFTETRDKYVNIARIMLAISNGEPWYVPSTIILDTLDSLVPRYFSISSSSLKSPHNLSITAVVEDYDNFKGVATNYLASLETKDKELVPVAVESSSFRLPSDPNTPLIMIGIGTGVAPFRGFMEERNKLAESQQVGESLLFLGSRAEDSFLYKDLFDNSVNLQVFPAYSRVGEKQYVQDQLLAHKDKIWELIESGAYIYICGSITRLRRHGRISISMIIAEKRGISYEEADKEFKSLRKEGRLFTDLW